MKKGFTLIELLAVIIILAIIAVIATPIILNVIDDARKSAGLSESEMIMSGINNYCATSAMRAQLDGSIDICTDEDGVTIDEVSKMVNLGNAKVEKVTYINGKVTELVIESNNNKYELQPDGNFSVNGEVTDPEEPVNPEQQYALLTTGQQFSQILFESSSLEFDTKIIFTQDKAPSDVQLKDLSANKDMSIVSWYNSEDGYHISTQDENIKIRFNEDSSNMIDLAGYTVEIIGLEITDTSLVKNFDGFLKNGTIMYNFNFSNLDLTNLEIITNIFENVNFTEGQINMNNWQIGNSNNNIFEYSSFENSIIDFSNWQFSGTEVKELFKNCTFENSIVYVNSNELSIWEDFLSGLGADVIAK